jgi:deoxyribonuclease IV
MSVAGGVETAFERGLRVGCEAIQIFTKNSNQWRARPLSPDEIARFRAGARASRIRPLLAHDSYLINPGSPRAPLLRRSREALEEELRRAEALGLDYLVIHPGAAVGAPEADCLRRVAETLDHVHSLTPGFKVKILLENTAGQGSSVGHRLEHLAAIFEAVEAPGRLGVCIDTCHLFAAGYDLRRPRAWERTMEQVAALGRVRAFHLNDSRFGLGERRDRHAHLGKGAIGAAAFGRLVRDPRWADVPGLLETPKEGDGDRRNLDLLRRMRRR